MTARPGYGWNPDLPDFRDYLYAPPPAVALPAAVDLRSQCPPVYDQGQLGSCTANALAAAYEFTAIKQGDPPVTPSRLFIYYQERVIESTVRTDSGAQLRDGAKVLATVGAPPETDWPYDTTKFARKPPAMATKDGLAHQALTYMRVPQTVAAIRGCLAEGFPVVFGFTVYASFESDAVAAAGVVPMPAGHEQTLGGHAVAAVGYDDASQRFVVRNSWGDQWGQAGYFTMPYAYLTTRGLASDLWTIRKVEA